MATKEYINRLSKIDELIRLKDTGSPKLLADKLHISERMLYEYINELREMGIPITYSRQLQSYIYTEPGYFFAGFICETKKVMGN